MSDEPSKPRTRKATRVEVDQRVEMVRMLLSMGKHKGEIKQAVKDQWHVTGRQAENYISRARSILLAETGRSKDEHRSEALAFYQQKRSGSIRDADQILAQKRIDKLLGLEAPTVVRVKVGEDDIDDQIRSELAKLATGRKDSDAAGATGEEQPPADRAPGTAPAEPA